MKNVSQLRNEMVNIFNDVKTDKLDLNKAKQLTHAAGTILNSVKCELVYSKLMGKRDKIAFLENK